MLEDLAARISREPSRRADLVREHARCVGAPTSRVYRQLAAMGHGSGRRRRADAGTTAAATQDLEVLASMMATAVRRTGQAVMYIPDARQILQAAGHELGGLSDGQLARLLRSQGSTWTHSGAARRAT